MSIINADLAVANRFGISSTPAFSVHGTPVLGAQPTEIVTQLIAGSTPITTRLSVFILGAVYGLAGFCSGPPLGAVLTVAVAGGQAPDGAFLMAVYAAGMTVPLAVLAALWDRFDLGDRKWLRGNAIRIGPIHTHATSMISGVPFIDIGVLFLFTAGTANLGGFIGADTAVALQGWLGRGAGNVDNFVVALVVVLVVIGVLIRRIRRTTNSVTRTESVRGNGENSAVTLRQDGPLRKSR